MTGFEARFGSVLKQISSLVFSPVRIAQILKSSSSRRSVLFYLPTYLRRMGMSMGISFGLQTSNFSGYHASRILYVCIGNYYVSVVMYSTVKKNKDLFLIFFPSSLLRWRCGRRRSRMGWGGENRVGHRRGREGQREEMAIKWRIVCYLVCYLRFVCYFVC